MQLGGRGGLLAKHGLVTASSWIGRVGESIGCDIATIKLGFPLLAYFALGHLLDSTRDLAPTMSAPLASRVSLAQNAASTPAQTSAVSIVILSSDKSERSVGNGDSPIESEDSDVDFREGGYGWYAAMHWFYKSRPDLDLQGRCRLGLSDQRPVCVLLPVPSLPN